MSQSAILTKITQIQDKINSLIEKHGETNILLGVHLSQLSDDIQEIQDLTLKSQEKYRKSQEKVQDLISDYTFMAMKNDKLVEIKLSELSDIEIIKILQNDIIDSHLEKAILAILKSR
jgi:hypothetical protein